jgi:uncharacterized membrane protein
MVSHFTSSEVLVVTLLPNRSIEWASLRLFIIIISITTLAVGTFWAFMGFWAILVFSGLDAILVGWLLCKVFEQSYNRQVISIYPENIKIQFGKSFPQRSWQLEKSKVLLGVADAPHPLAPIGLRIYDSQHSIELGDFLNKEDKEEALSLLKAAGLKTRTYNKNSLRPV